MATDLDFDIAVNNEKLAMLRRPPVATELPCVCGLHRHIPRAEYCEMHHVVPQAWQHTVSPKLLDPRVIALTPTCHRNVHVWIVRLMRELERQGEGYNLYPSGRSSVFSNVRRQTEPSTLRYYTIGTWALTRALETQKIDLWRMTQLKLYGEA